MSEYVVDVGHAMGNLMRMFPLKFGAGHDSLPVPVIYLFSCFMNNCRVIAQEVKEKKKCMNLSHHLFLLKVKEWVVNDPCLCYLFYSLQTKTQHLMSSQFCFGLML